MRLVVVTALLSALLVSCGHSAPSGDSALAKQLVGHWATGSDDHLYFGAIDAASHTGSYILVHPDGKAFNHKYRIDAENASDRSLKVTMMFASGDSRETTYVFSADGKTLESVTIITGIETRGELTRVDDATAPAG
jgi:hypothetical protein